MTGMETAAAPENVPAKWLTDTVATIFNALGLSQPAAWQVADSLVEADMRGIPSHGVMLVPMYAERIREGSVTLRERADVVTDHGAIAVLDAGHALGILTGDQAMALAVKKARTFGVGAVAVRRAFHFGGAFRYARSAAEQGCLGLAAANTRPLMPAPGGASAVVGNNPLAISVPRAGNPHVVLDIAMSQAALGKIRLAEAEGRQIPPTWATDATGRPTTDPAAAVAGLLLPAGGHKGYGIAFMIDVLAGVLSGGAYGQHVHGLYSDTSQPNDCAHFFLALDVGSFGDVDEFGRRLADLCDQVLFSVHAPGVDQVFLPGDIEYARYTRARQAGVALAPSVLAQLMAVAAAVGVSIGDPPTEGR